MQRKITKNIFYNVTYKLLNVLFPLLSTAIVSRVLLPIGVGKFTAAQNVATYFTFLAPLGLMSYGTREVAKTPPASLNKLFSELFVLNSVSTAICIAIYYSMINLIPYFSQERKLYEIAGLAIVLNFFNIDWFYQGKEEFRYITIRSMIVKALMLLGILIFVRNVEDYRKYALIHVLAIGGNYVLNVFHVRKSGVRIMIKGLCFKKHLSAVFILFATNIAVELYSLVDTTMLSVMCSPEKVAYYSNAMRLVKVAIFVIAAVGGVVMPRIIALLSEQNQDAIDQLLSGIVKIMLALALPCGVGMACMSDRIVYVLFGEAFEGSVPIVIVLSCLFYFLTFSNFLGTQVLVAYKREKDVLISTIIGAITNICLNSLLIPRLEQMGAAVASVISEFIVLTVMILYARKCCRIKHDGTFVISLAVGCLIMAVGVLGIKQLLTDYMWSLVCGILAGVVLYGSVILLFNRKLVMTVRELLGSDGGEM